MYTNAAAFRQAIEARLNQRAREESIDINRLRRALVFDRILVRLESGDAGAWVVKGGMALEWQLKNRARGTRDLDLVMRGAPVPGGILRDKLTELLAEDPQRDRFVFRLGEPEPLDVGFRFRVLAELAGRQFASVQVDVALRASELMVTQRLPLPWAVPSFELLQPPEVEAAAPSQHFAEKLHALTRDRGGHANTRKRDIVDLLVLIELDLVDARTIFPVVQHVFTACGTHAVPDELHDPPVEWAQDYAREAAKLELGAGTLADAMVCLRSFWGRARSF